MAGTLHLVGLLATAGISLATTWWVRGRTDDHAGTVMVVLLLAHAAMALLATGHLLADGRWTRLAFYQVRYAVGLFAFALWVVLAIYYTGHAHWLTRPVWALLLGLPALTGALWLSNSVHGLMVVEFQYVAEPFTYVRPEYAPLSIVLSSALFFMPMMALALFLRLFLFSQRRYRVQTAAVVVGMVAVFAASAIGESDAVAAPGFAYGIYGSAVFAVVVALALFRSTLFAVLPLARDAVFESIDDAILIVDREYRVVDYNRTTRELFPTVDERVDAPLSEVYPGLRAPEEGSRTDGGGARAIVDHLDGAADSPFAARIRVTVEDEPRTLRVSVSEIASGGEPRGYALIMRDVTSLEDYAAELEHKTEQLEAKTEKLEQFASALSHDLRNPVSVAIGYVQHAVETGDPEHAEPALEALERIDDTIENLLALSREGETIDDPDEVALAAVVDDAWTTSDTGAATLENEVDPDWRCRADAERLQTLLENLFRNAADHGGNRVRVGTTGEGFFVADDGPGIPRSERDRIFEYGYSTSADGTGLGLAIVQAVADAHGWDLAVGEAEAGGARVEVRSVERGARTSESAAS